MPVPDAMRRCKLKPTTIEAVGVKIELSGRANPS